MVPDIAVIKSDPEVETLISIAESQIKAIGYTEHSRRHVSIVSKWSADIMRGLNYPEDRIRLAEIAGYLHDIGNAVNRACHAQTGALLAYNILRRLGTDERSAAEIMMAVGNHDEQYGSPVSDITSALIIADKADVHRSRVKKNIENAFTANIHDRVNLAAERSFLTVEREGTVIVLNIEINTELCSVMDYFEIYFNRMQLCRRAAQFLGCRFTLDINGNKLI